MERLNPNSGKDWSDTDLTDLQQCIKIGMADTDIAGFLSRTVTDVRERAEELVGISFGPSEDDKSETPH
jgi:hypothetical protein